MTKEMTNKLISFDLESTGYTDEDGNFVEPEKAEDLAKVAVARMLSKEENKTMKVYKKSVDNKYLLLVGELKDKEIVLYEPSKCIHQVDYQSPDLYELPYYAEDGEVVDRFPDSRELLVDDSKFSFGYYDKNKIVFWEQYLKGI